MQKRSSKKDINQIAASVVARATEQDKQEPAKAKNPAAVALGKLGGLKGGIARAKKLSLARRREIAKKAALTRWES